MSASAGCVWMVDTRTLPVGARTLHAIRDTHAGGQRVQTDRENNVRAVDIGRGRGILHPPCNSSWGVPHMVEHTAGPLGGIDHKKLSAGTTKMTEGDSCPG